MLEIAGLHAWFGLLKTLQLSSCIPTRSPSRRKRPHDCQQTAVLVLAQVSVIDTRHNHYSWRVAAAELLVMQCMSGCACQVSLTTVWCEEEEHERGKLKWLLGNLPALQVEMIFKEAVQQQRRTDRWLIIRVILFSFSFLMCEYWIKK